MREKPTARIGFAAGRTRLLPFESRVLQTMKAHGMIEYGSRILVGVSGGADSTALLICLNRLAQCIGVSLSVAHLNHRLRGGESDADEEFVRKLSVNLGLSFVSETLEVGGLVAGQGKNLEEAARDARYEFLKRIARREGATRIAVGHNMNDQAETVLLHLFRGSGIEGLSAIHPVADQGIIRPLLERSRQEILEYLADLCVEYREDTSNRDLRFRRNRARHEWIPYLEKHFNPSLVKTLAREADLARETADFLNQWASKEFRRLRIPREKSVVVPAEGLNRLQPVIRKLVLRQALREVCGSLRGITAHHIEKTLSLCRPAQSGRTIQLPRGVVACREFHNIIFFSNKPLEARSFSYPLSIPGRCIVPEADVEISASLETRAGAPEGGRSVLLDAESLPASLVVRSRLPGDRYGGPGHRKVKKMLIDAKIELHARALLPMIAAADCVVWVPGFEPAKPFRMRHGSKCVMLEVVHLVGR